MGRWVKVSVVMDLSQIDLFLAKNYLLVIHIIIWFTIYVKTILMQASIVQSSFIRTLLIYNIILHTWFSGILPEVWPGVLIVYFNESWWWCRDRTKKSLKWGQQPQKILWCVGFTTSGQLIHHVPIPVANAYTSAIVYHVSIPGDWPLGWLLVPAITIELLVK